MAAPGTIARDASQIAGDFLLDGEAVGDILHVFDLLESGGINHRSSPYADRLHLLTHLLPSTFNCIVPVYTAHGHREKVHLLERLRRENKEGVVLKNLTARYSPGKTSGSNADQLKYKF